MTRPGVLVFVLLMFLALPLAAAENSLDGLAWISGTWEGTHGNVRQEEHWTNPAGGLILGLHRDLFEGGRSFFEFLRIEQRDDEIYYIAMPRGRSATEFRLIQLEDGHVVFENPEHDFPQRIVYSRKGDTLSARIEGEQDGETRSSGWEWKRVQQE
jgi:hypothetical protein